MNDCIIWTGYLNESGYGYSGRVVNGERLAHRIAYVAAKGPIPADLQLDHLCRVRSCYNPEHLEAVTPSENTRRAHVANPKTHCRRGHELTPDNVKIGSDGYRTCRTCYRNSDRAAHARKRLATVVDTASGKA